MFRLTSDAHSEENRSHKEVPMKRYPVAVAIAVLAACGGEEQKPAPQVPSTPTATATTTASAPPTATTPPAPEPPKLTMIEMQKKYLEAEQAAWEAKDATKLAALYAEDGVLASPGKDGMKEIAGRSAIEAHRKEYFERVTKGFPDMKWTRGRVLAKGDTLIVEFAASGTDTGGFMGAKPTNKKVGVRGISIQWFDDKGHVKKEHTYVDQATLMGQLGMGPPGWKARAAAEAVPPAAGWVEAKGGAEDDKNVEHVKAIYSAMEKKDEKAFLALITDDAVHSDLTQPTDAKGKAAAKAEFAMFTKAMPDIKVNATNSWGFGDLVVTEVEFSGTLKGAMGPIKATNKSGTTHNVDVSEFKDGKIARVTSYGSGLEFAAVYGLLPPEPKAPPAKK
jgi:steroid delta-isomerase-like uncharacterized protein/uncharacterized protein (TIGR02246 family)